MVKLVLTTFHLFNIIHVNLLKGGNDMNVHMIRVKHIETNFRQKNLNNAFGITEKVMCHALDEYHKKLPIFYFENGNSMQDDKLDELIYGYSVS